MNCLLASGVILVKTVELSIESSNVQTGILDVLVEAFRDSLFNSQNEDCIN